MSAEQRLKELGIELPPPMSPAGAYRPVVIANGLAHVSGQGPVYADRTMITGKVPSERSVKEGVEAARLTALNSLAILRDHLGSLDRIEEAVRVLGLVNADPGFHELPRVIDGYSNLFVEVFGEAGKAARSAIGVAALPFDISVEVEITVKLRD